MQSPQPCPVFIYRPGLAVNPVGPWTASTRRSTPCQRHLSRAQAASTPAMARPPTVPPPAAQDEPDEEEDGDLGHFDLLRRDEEIDDLQHILQLVHHLRHNSVKSRQQRSDVSRLLHGVPQNPLLRPDLVEAVRPGAPKLQHTVVVVKRALLRNFAVYCVSNSSPSPCLFWSCALWC